LPANSGFLSSLRSGRNDRISGEHRLRSGGLPGIDQGHAAAFEIGSVACGQDGPAGVGDGSDLRVEVGDWTASRAARGGYFWKGARGRFIERKDASGEVFHERRLGLGKHLVVPPSLGKKFDAEQDFRHRDGGHEEMAAVRLSG